MRTVTLPHHRTCGFPHPAVEPGSGLAHCVLPWSPMAFHSALLHLFRLVRACFPSLGSFKQIHCFTLPSRPVWVVRSSLAPRLFRETSRSAFPEFFQLVCLVVLWPFAPSGFHRLSSLLRPLLTSARLSLDRSPRVRCPLFRPASSGSTSCVFR